MCGPRLSTCIKGFNQFGWFITQKNIFFLTLKDEFLPTLITRQKNRLMCYQVIYSPYSNKYPKLF